jgi:hypothetical protein
MEDAMSKKQIILNFCANCKNASTCIYIKNSKHPIVQCEEFESYSVSNKTRYDKSEIITNHKYKGLCQNCDNRETCMYRKPEGGVWHCEDYM